MKVAIRVDASSQMGTGHFMRCLTLADALKHRRASVRFVSRHLPEHLRGMALAAGHQVTLLEGSPDECIAGDLAHAHWLGTSQSADAQESIEAVSDLVPDWWIVDHYALDARWECAVRQAAKKILAIDDIADRRHDCDVLLDQNLFKDMETRYATRVPAQCKLLLGPSYALLRDEFRRMRQVVSVRSGPIKRVLVFFGGVDEHNCTSRAVEALVNIGIADLHVDVVIGAQHPFRQQVESSCVRSGFACHVQSTRMAELCAAADIAIGAGGSATWERCCLALPSLVVSLADNQLGIAAAIDRFGAGVHVGTLETAVAETIRKAVLDLVDRTGYLESLSERSFSLADGRGIDRVCDAMGA